MTETPRYGYIGLGVMGIAMVENLANQGHRPVVHDIDPAAVARAVELGAVAAADAAAVAAASDVVSICVPAARHIEAVLTGPGGIASGAHPGLEILVHATVEPETIHAAAATAAGWGVPLYDACVAGGERNARAGTQTMLVGGLSAMGPMARGLVGVYGETIIDAGPVGAGAALKIAVNVMTYAQMAAAATAYDLTVGAGIDPEMVFEAWRAMGQMGALTENYAVLLRIPPQHLVGGFRAMLESQVGIAQKDLALAMALGATRPGTGAVLAALHDAAPALYVTPDPGATP